MKINEISLKQTARWLCLIECVNIIDRYTTENNINNDKGLYDKSPHIQNYIKERFPSMLEQLRFNILKEKLSS